MIIMLYIIKLYALGPQRSPNRPMVGILIAKMAPVFTILPALIILSIQTVVSWL